MEMHENQFCVTDIWLVGPVWRGGVPLRDARAVLANMECFVFKQGACHTGNSGLGRCPSPG